MQVGGANIVVRLLALKDSDAGPHGRHFCGNPVHLAFNAIKHGALFRKSFLQIGESPAQLRNVAPQFCNFAPHFSNVAL